jgi:hypothetical protein
MGETGDDGAVRFSWFNRSGVAWVQGTSMD